MAAGSVKIPAQRGRGRRPTAQVRDEILAAAGELLVEQGMRAFTIDRVAALSGASKMTLYKFWPTKGVLALEAFESRIAGAVAVPDSGNFRTDLSEQLVAYVRLLCDTRAGRVFAELVGAAQTDPELASAIRRNYSGPRRAYGLAVLRAAQKRGEIRADADPEVLIDQLWGACLYRLIMPDHELTEEFARALVENLMCVLFVHFGQRLGVGDWKGSIR